MAPIVVQAYTGGVQQLTSSYADVAGSSYTYTPVYSSSRITYRFNFQVSAVDASGAAHFRAYVAGTEQTAWRCSIQMPSWDSRATIEFTYENGNTTPKAFKLQAREYDAANETKLHETTYFDGAASAQSSGAVLTIIEVPI
jgi:hypothetical protein